MKKIILLITVLIFSMGIKQVWSQGIGVNTTTPKSMLDVEGNVAIGATYSGTTAAPANGMIVEGNVGIGTSAPGGLLELYNTGGAANNFLRLFDGTADYRLFIDANNDLNFTKIGTGGAEMEFEDGDIHLALSSGNVSIGKTNPAVKLEVQGTVGITNGTVRWTLEEDTPTAHDLTLAHNSAAAARNLVFGTLVNGGESMRIESDGDVGIGISAPTSKLHILAATDQDGAKVTGNVNNVALHLDNTNTGGREFGIYSTGGASGAGQGKLGFYDVDGGAYRMVIDGAGDVGIGATNPLFKLHVADATSPSIVVQDNTNTVQTYMQSADAVGILGTNSNHNLTIRTNATDRIRVTSTGNVGIGDTGPDATLEIAETGTTPFMISNGAAGDGDFFIVQTDGDVGIGTNSPTSGIVQIEGGGSNNDVGLWVNENHTLGLLDNIVSNITGNHNTGDGYVSSAFKAVFEAGAVGYAYSVMRGDYQTAADLTVHIDADGDAYFAGAVEASCGTLTCSDIRYKEKITPLENTLAKISELKGVYYFWKKDEFPNKSFGDERQIGVIAQELENQFPELVVTKEDGYKVVDYARLSAVLLQAINELNTKLKEKETDDQYMVKKMDELEKKYNLLLDQLSKVSIDH